MRRWILFEVAVCIASITLYIAYVRPPRTYHGVQIAWTEKEVENFLRRLPDQPRAPAGYYGYSKLASYGSTIAIWDGAEDIIVCFDDGGRVTFAFRWDDDSAAVHPLHKLLKMIGCQ